MKFSQFLNESETKYKDRYKLEDALYKNKAKLKKVEAAFEENYSDSDNEDNFDEDSFVYKIVKSLKDAGVNELANAIHTIKDVESVEHYISNIDDISSVANKLHYHQNLDDIAKAILDYVVG